MLEKIDWQNELANLAYAQAKPSISGLIKAHAEDFCVTEVMDVELAGSGEHVWLRVRKQECNTDQVAKALARFASVSYRDVGYSGMKDYFAVTEQWFSVWRPKGKPLNWDEFNHQGVQILEYGHHFRKLKRGMHHANRFEITIRHLKSLAQGSQNIKNELNARCLKISEQGVPNYYGAQRFGRQAGNLNKARTMMVEGQRIKDRGLRGLLLSSARAWLFNVVVSERVKANTWQQLLAGEPANLSNSNSVFISSETGYEQDQQQRLSNFDIHPTGPLWGRGVDKLMNQENQITKIENESLSKYSEFCVGLEKAGLEYQRRALRMRPNNFQWQINSDQLSLRFELGKGQFATSVLREIVCEELNKSAAVEN